MTFICEYVSEENIEKYNLDQYLNKYIRVSSEKLPNKKFRHSWVVDSDRQLFFMHLKKIMITGESGLDEPSSESIFLLKLREHEYEITLSKNENGSYRLDDNPYIIIWDLLEVNKVDDREDVEFDHISILKEALKIYGYAGVHSLVKGTVQVNFNF